MRKKTKLNFGDKSYFIAPTKDGIAFGRSKSPSHITIYSRLQDGILFDAHKTSQLKNRATRKNILKVREGDSITGYQLALQELDAKLKKYEIPSENTIYTIPQERIKELICFNLKETKNNISITTKDLDTLATEVIEKIELIPMNKQEFLNSQDEIGLTLNGEFVLKIRGYVVIWGEEAVKTVKESKYWQMLNLDQLNIE